MIDLHNHILPGIDDGARDFAESVAIATQFVEEGVETVAATPHLDPLYRRGASFDRIVRLVDEVNEALEAHAVQLRVLPGNELFLTPDADELIRSGQAHTLAGTNYVLVEVSLSAVERPLYLDDTLFRLQLAGYRPILAHPERYPFVQRDASVVEALLERGVALQLTAPSLLGEYGGRIRRTAESLLERGAYSLASSDRHHPGPSRSLKALAQRLSTMQGDELPRVLLQENPGRVIRGEALRDVEPVLARQPSLLSRLIGHE